MTISEARFAPGDIVKVLFPHAERRVHVPRPALVLSGKPIGPDGLLFWAAMITSAARATWPGDFAVAHMEGTGLRHASLIRMEKISSLPTDSAQRIGQLASREFVAVQQAFHRHLGWQA